MEERESKPRKDKKHRFVFRINSEIWEEIRALSYNHNLSYNQILDKLVSAALRNQEIMHAFTLAYPRNSNYILVRESE